MKNTKLLKPLALSAGAAALFFSASASAVPYAIPSPTAESCRNDQVLQELTDNISNGTLKGEQNLLASMNFVQSCQDILYPEHKASKRHSMPNHELGSEKLN